MYILKTEVRDIDLKTLGQDNIEFNPPNIKVIYKDGCCIPQ